MTERDIFIAALQRDDPDARRAYLAEACGPDAALRTRVEELLAVHERAASFLESPPAGPTVTIDHGTEGPGTLVGPYKLLERIGEGGFGVVFLAEQTVPVRRKVALKVLKPGMDTRQVVARFEAERPALAIMDHPNIARVFDGGVTPSGRPFFVMELVKGVPITDFCDQNQLTPRQRLELFVPVCQAVQHAHQKGIVHRDLKPSNVLVSRHDTTPVVKVIDFEVAKALGRQLTDKTLFTGVGQIVGTPLYMSPEQAGMSDLDVDTRSDIYSLGVLLYELLTGSTPFTTERFKRAAYDEIRRIIREEEPPKPSTRLSESKGALPSISAQRQTEPAKLTRLVRGELDWIVMKALEKDRNRRYETANGFAMDVQRYLADEAVQACPPSALYRFRKFARRNKAMIAFTGLVLLILLTVTGGIGWNLRDRAARQTAVEQEVNLALKEAEQLQEQSKWPEALSAVKRAQGLLAGGGTDELRERVRQHRKDLEMVLRLEEIPLLSSEFKENKLDFETADRAYTQAFGDYGIDVVQLPVDEAAACIRARSGVTTALAAALDFWAIVRGKEDKAGPLTLTALAQAIDPDPWRRQVREAVKQKDTKALAALAASPELLRQPPTSLLVLARALHAGGLAEGEIELLRKAQRQYPGDYWINRSLASALYSMGPPYRDEFISFARAALAVRPQSSAAHSDLGIALRQQGKVDQAIACYHKAIELDPKNANAYSCLGRAFQEQQKLDEAIAEYRKAIELDPNDGASHGGLGYALEAQGKLDEAIAEYRKAIELAPKNTWAFNALGRALVKNGWYLANHQDPRRRDPKRAVELVKEAVELAPQSVAAWQDLGWVRYQAGNWKASIDALETSCKLQNPGDCGQWIVMSLAHVKLANDKELSEQERDRHKTEARRWYDLAVKQIDGHPGLNDGVGRAIRAFRAEAAELFDAKEKPK
jgi:serine/threonine protein kinase/Flp pilus assembly protein TadD